MKPSGTRSGARSHKQGSFTRAEKHIEVGRAGLTHQICVVYARFFRRQKGALKMDAEDARLVFRQRFGCCKGSCHLFRTYR